jgi:hypothetical protein
MRGDILPLPCTSSCSVLSSERGNIIFLGEPLRSIDVGRAIASHCGGPDSSPGQVMWDLWWTKWQWGRFYPSTSVSPANLHSTNCSTITIIYHLGLLVQ